MSKHTPGPWKWDGPVWDYDPEDEAPWLVDNKGAPILEGSIWCSSEHDARLIAQAPRLLEALEPFVALLQSHNDTNEHGNPVPDNQPVFAINGATITIGDLRKARAAIAAATKETSHD